MVPNLVVCFGSFGSVILLYFYKSTTGSMCVSDDQCYHYDNDSRVIYGKLINHEN